MSLYTLLTNKEDCKQRIAFVAEHLAYAHDRCSTAIAKLTAHLEDTPKQKAS